jgi:alpha-mannosidase
LEETKRKIVRTAANQIRLMESFSEYRFVCSQAYLYEVLKERLPELYERVQAAVKRRQWITVGGSWVEPDCNMPSGESLVRQFLHGQRFFQQEFGSLSTECWLQDSFGYAAQLPQIMKMAGMERFVSQKLHWGHLKPRIRLFHWQGLDGTKVLAHYPPEFTFSNPLTVAAVNKVARQYSEDDRSPNSLMSFGWGDGGGGPNRFMVELVSRLANLQGVPKVKMRSPAEFFLDLERDLKARPPLVQVGEIHFSRHRGTFTSQSMTKSKMRAAERVLHDLEFLSAIASRLGVQAYPSQELTRLWKIVLRNQHHDILTGTSIAIVHETAVQELSAVEEEANDIKTKMLSGLASLRRAEPLVPVGSSPGKRISAISTAGNGNEPAADLAINTIGFSRREVAATVEGDLVIVEAPSYGQGSVHFHGADKAQVQAHEDRTTVIIENEKLRAEFAKTGLLLKLIHKETGRDALSAPGNQFQIFDDYPNDFDAWEIELFHQETMRNCPAASDCQLRTEPLRAEIRFVHKIGEKSSLEQTVRLDALSNRLEFHCHANWQEEHRLLKVSFPAAVNATVATYDTQFGAIERPTHFNTPEDQSRFEVVGHKWADLSEHGFGMALLSDCKYGFSVQENQMRLSLLRAPKSPDPNCDLGEHAFSYALMPHSSRWQDGGVVAEAYKFNYPLLWATPVGVSEEIQAPHSFISVDDPNLVIETLKKAEDSDGLIIRLYECHGARGAAKLSIELPFTSACRADLLEREGEAVAVKNGQIEVSYAPFQIMTLVIK